MAEKGSVSKGDIIRLDYKAYISENEKVFDTTMESVAKDANIFNEKQTYAPVPYRVGSGTMFFPALDDAMVGVKVGKETTAKIASADGAGARDPKLIEVHAMKEFSKMDVAPYPGLEVAMGNKQGTVISVGAGRVRVDFNNPLAGKDVVYVFTVNEIITDPAEKAKAILEMDFGTSEDFNFEIKEEKVTVTVSEITKFRQDWALAKYRIVADLRETFNVDTVEFLEIWSRAAPKDSENAEKPAAKKKAPAKKEAAAADNADKKEAKASTSTVKKETAKPAKAEKPKVNDADRAKSQAQKK